jgi:hypothetical protein
MHGSTTEGAAAVCELQDCCCCWPTAPVSRCTCCCQAVAAAANNRLLLLHSCTLEVMMLVLGVAAEPASLLHRARSSGRSIALIYTRCCLNQGRRLSGGQMPIPSTHTSTQKNKGAACHT